MTDQITAPPAAGTSSDSPAPPPVAPRAESSTWLWIRSLGYVRGDGWLGGVCAGIAHRIGVDPVIVRGVFVVATLLGFPGLWLYALAWAVLPDRAGRIAVRAGRSGDPAIAGIVAVVIGAVLASWASTSLAALVFGISFSSGLSGALASLIVWGGAISAAIAVLVWLSRRAPARFDLPRTGDDGGVSGTTAVSGGAASGAAPPHSPEPVEPLPDALASAEELDAWRAQHAAWREQHEAWRVAQADGSAAAAEERARRQAEYAAFRAQVARERAERRALRPRASMAFVAITVGAALVVGTVVWILFQPNRSAWAGYAAVLAAAAVIGLAMVLAGARRRRSGFLAAVTLILLAIGGSGVAMYLVDDMIGPDRYVPMPDGDLAIDQPWGQLTLDVGGVYDESGETRVSKGSGQVWITVQAGIDVEFETTSGTGSVWVEELGADGIPVDSTVLQPREGRFTWSHDDPRSGRTRTIVLDQKDVDVMIQVMGTNR